MSRPAPAPIADQGDGRASVAASGQVLDALDLSWNVFEIEAHTASSIFEVAMMRFAPRGKEEDTLERGIRDRLGSRSIVLVGMPGCGKSAIGRRLAPRLDLPFVDADEEIEQAAGKSIKEIFADHGEAYFRDGERRVIARLLACGSAGACDWRRRTDARGNAREHSPRGHIRLGQSGLARARASRLEEKQSSAVRGPRPGNRDERADGGALPDLRDGRHRGGKP